jgi:hypothetical protein
VTEKAAISDWRYSDEALSKAQHHKIMVKFLLDICLGIPPKYSQKIDTTEDGYDTDLEHDPFWGTRIYAKKTTNRNEQN